MPGAPPAPGPPPFWFQNENPASVCGPPRSNVTRPVRTPGADTHEFGGIVPSCSATSVGAESPAPLIVFTSEVPNPDPLLVVAPAGARRPALALAAKRNR